MDIQENNFFSTDIMDTTQQELLSHLRRLSEGIERTCSATRHEPSVLIERKIFDVISKRLLPYQWRLLGKHLGFNKGSLMQLEKESKFYNYGMEANIVRMLEKWKKVKHPHEDQLVSILETALNAIKRHDIAEKIQKECRHRNSYELNDLQKEIQAVQKNNFRDITLPTSLGLGKNDLSLDEVFMEINMTSQNKWGQKDDGKIIKEELFTETENLIPRRILIEGRSGCGKTTLVAKLLSDWSRGEKYISDRFDLVFVIPLRNYEGNLSEHFLQQCRGIKGSDEEKLWAIKSIEENVLLLLDGLEETQIWYMQNLYSLIDRSFYGKMTVVATCRTSFVRTETKSNEAFGLTKINDFKEYSVWDKRIKIKGISFEKRWRFLQKYIPVDDGELITKISQSNVELTDLFQCPLFLLLLAFLIQEGDTRPIGTQTELYKRVFNLVINRGLENLSGQKGEYDIFDSKKESQEFGYRSLLINFGRLCLDKIKHQRLIFYESELFNCSGGTGDEDFIIKPGLLSKRISFLNYEKELYEPIHKSVLEFFAAFYLSSLNGSEMEREIQELVLKYNMGPKGDQFIYSFLGGLLQSKAFKLFNSFSPTTSLISIFNDGNYHLYNIQDVLLEIPQTEEILKSLDILSIGNWERVKYKDSLHQWFIGLLNNLQKRGKDISLRIPENLNIINSSSLEKIQINTIRIHVRNNEITEGYIQCENLLLHIEHITSNIVQPVLKRIRSKVKAEKVWLEVSFHKRNPETVEEARGFINSCKELIEHSSLYYLSLRVISPSLFSLISPYIKDLIENQRIEFGIYIQFSHGIHDDSFKDEFKSFREIVSNSHLKSFGIDKDFFKDPLPFPAIFSNNDKQMQFVGLKGLFGGTEIDEAESSISVHHLHCIDLKIQTNFLPKLLFKCRNMKRLSCHGHLICDLGVSHSVTEWTGFETIDRLDLRIETIQDENCLLKGLSLFNTIREISLIDFGNYSDLCTEIVCGLPSLKKVRYWSLEYFPMKLLEGLIALKDEDEEWVKTFDEFEIEVLRGKDYSSMYYIECLEKCFIKRVFHKFSVLNTNLSDVHGFLKYFISKTEFHVSSEWKEIPRHDQLLELQMDSTPELKLKLSIWL